MKTILVVDDSLVSRKMIRHAVAALGHEDVEFVEASSGGEALQLLAARPIDLVLSDLYMPNGTGLDLVERARATGLALPIVIITSERSEEVLGKLRAAGVTDVIAKPLQADPLRRALEAVAAS